MAENSEWRKRGASISIEHAWKEYGATLDFIKFGIQSGKLDFREGKIKGRPYARILRNQLENYISEEPRGALHIARLKAHRELLKVAKSVNFQRKILEELMARKAEIDVWLAQNPMPRNSNQLAN